MKLTCPNCNVTFNVKRLTHTGNTMECTCGAAPRSNADWINNTTGVNIAPDTYFFTGRGKKKKWLQGKGFALAGQAGPGTGTGSVHAQGWGARLTAGTSDVSIHVVDDDVTLIGEYKGVPGQKHLLILNGSGQDTRTYNIGSLFTGFNQLGHSCLSVDYRGYGDSTGSTSKQGMYADARAMIGYLLDAKNVPLTDIYLHGWSIGSAPALEAAKSLEESGNHVGGLILQCPISSTYKAARAHGENVIMASIGHKMFAMNNYRKIGKLAHTRVLILKGTQDNTGFQDMADDLHAHLNGSTLADFDGGHADHFKIFLGTCAAALGQFIH